MKYFTYTIYGNGRKVGITFAPMPSLSYQELLDLINELRKVKREMFGKGGEGAMNEKPKRRVYGEFANAEAVLAFANSDDRIEPYNATRARKIGEFIWEVWNAADYGKGGEG
jgi:hypothetical protein